MLKRCVSSIWSMAFFLLWITQTVRADVVGNLVVHVFSAADEKPVSDIIVTAQDAGENQPPLQARTNSDGLAEFHSLAIGEYKISIDGKSWISESQRAVIRVNAPTEISFYLTQEGEKEPVLKVVSKRLLMNAKDTAGSSTFKDRSFIEKRMADNSSLASVANLSPGVTADSQGLLHFRGEHRSMSLEVDGVLLPIPLQSQIGSLVDPRFLEQLEVRTGSYDPTFSGQLGGVLNLVTRSGATKSSFEFRPEIGNFGELGGVVMAEGSGYFFGVSTNHTNLRLEAPNPTLPTFNNQGDDTNSLLHFLFQEPKDKINLTLGTQNLRLNLPNTPIAQSAGVNQWQRENNLLGVLSLRHQFSPETEMLFGVSFLGSHQAVGNNGVFTPWTTANSASLPDAAAEMLPQNAEDPGNPFLPNLSRTGSQKLLNVILSHSFSATNAFRFGGTANFIRLDDTIDVMDAGGAGTLPGGVVHYVASDHRSGFNGGLFMGDVLSLTPKFSANFGVRLDRYNNGINVSTIQASPLFNFSYAFSPTQALRWSYDRLFTAPPLEPDPSGATTVIPQKTSSYELSYETQPSSTFVMRLGGYLKNYRDPLDLALLVPLSNLPVFVPVNFPKGQTVGVEFSAMTNAREGLNWFVNLSGTSMHILQPSPGTTSIPLVDHFENQLATFGPSYQWKNGLFCSFDNKYGSGFPQDAIVAYNKDGVYPFGIRGKQSRFISNFNFGYSPNYANRNTKDVHVSIQILNLLNSKRVLNLLSNYSGTRFVKPREFQFNLSLNW